MIPSFDMRMLVYLPESTKGEEQIRFNNDYYIHYTCKTFASVGNTLLSIKLL